MTQIYNVIEGTENRYVVDPDRGVVQRSELVMQASDVDRIVHEDGTFEVGPHGTFQVPDHVAAHFLRQPGWHQGANPFAEVNTGSEGKAAKSRAKAAA